MTIEEYNKALDEIKQELLKEGDTVVTKQDLLERFCDIDEEYKGGSWNLLQILANINILIGQKPLTTNWISCSEQLPKDFQRVLVTIVNYNGDSVVRVAEYSRRTFKIKENYEQWNVGEKGLLAWMPMPEPYDAEMESKE